MPGKTVFHVIKLRVSKTLIGTAAWQIAQKNLGKRLLHDGAETQKSWKPLLNTIFALGGLAEWFVQRSTHEFFCAICHQMAVILGF